MSNIGKFPDVPQSVDAQIEAPKAQELSKSDSKIQGLFASKKAVSSEPVAGIKRQRSFTLDGKFSNSLVAAFKRITSKISTPQAFFHKVTHFFSNAKATKKQEVQKSFEEGVLKPLSGTKNKEAALKATVAIFEQAEAAGTLDRKVYRSLTRQLEQASSNSRRSISLDDLHAERTIHQELLDHVPAGSNLHSKLTLYSQTSQLISYLDMEQDMPKLKEAFRETLIRSYQTDMSHANLEMGARVERARDDLTDLATRKALTLDAYKAIVTTGAKAAGDANAFVKGLMGSLGGKTLEQVSRYRKVETAVTMLEQMQIYKREFAENPKQMGMQHKWMQENGVDLGAAKPQTATWHVELEKLEEAFQATLQEAVDGLQHIQDPDEKKEAVQATARMLAFGGRTVGDLGESLRSASSTREQALARLQLIKGDGNGVKEEMLRLLSSDLEHISSNQILNRSSEVLVGDLGPNDLVLIDGKLQSADVLAGHPKDEKAVKAFVNPYIREQVPQDRIKILQKALDQYTKLQELGSSQAEEGIKKLEGLLEECKNQLLQDLAKAINPNDSATRELLIAAIKAYPALTEITVGGFTAILVPNEKNELDLVVLKEELGRGGAAIAYKAFSVRAQQHVVVKYATELALQSNEEENAQKMLGALGANDGIQQAMQLHTLKTQDGPKKVTMVPLYAEKGNDENVLREQFFKEVLNLRPEEWGNQEAVLNKFENDLMQFFTGPSSKSEKEEKLRMMSENYLGILSAILGKEDAERLLELYKSLF